jgi:hypothetical protein
VVALRIGDDAAQESYHFVDGAINATGFVVAPYDGLAVLIERLPEGLTAEFSEF